MRKKERERLIALANELEKIARKNYNFSSLLANEISEKAEYSKLGDEDDYKELLIGGIKRLQLKLMDTLKKIYDIQNEIKFGYLGD